MVGRWVVGGLVPAIAFVSGWIIAAPERARPADPGEVGAVEVDAAADTKLGTRSAPDPGLVELEQIAAGELPKYPARRLGELASSGPALAASQLGRLSETERVAPTYEVAASWASVDPEAALAWIRSLPETDMAEKARALVMCVWFDVDPGAAMERFRRFGAEAQRRMLDQRMGWQLSVPLDRATDRHHGYTYSESSIGEVILRGLPDEQAEEILTLMEQSAVDRVRRAAERARGA